MAESTRPAGLLRPALWLVLIVSAAADAASSAAEWASTVPEQAKQVQARLTEAASASIRERPIAIVAGALVIGYLLGRMGS